MGLFSLLFSKLKVFDIFFDVTRVTPEPRRLKTNEVDQNQGYRCIDVLACA